MSVFAFPNPVNDKAARTVGAGVLVLGAVTLATGWWWVAAVLAVGFLLRVLAGPRFSPLSRLATQVVAPRLGPPKLVPGPPKRFAQALGLAFTVVITVLLAADHDAAGRVVTGLLLVAASLESVLGFCVGCAIFGRLMQLGVIPESVCLSCATTAYEA